MTTRVLQLAALLALLFVTAGGGSARAQQPAPETSARAAILVEESSGDALYERAADKRRAIASTTKLMTALLTMERAELSERVRASDYVAAPIESQLGLRPGERMTVADMLRGLMLESANDVAVALAEHVGGTRERFVRMMNRRARELGLDGTHYANPIGLDDAGNYSTARDLATLAIELRKHSFVRKIANRTSATLSSGDPRPPVSNRNTLLAEDDRVNGLKTGRTLAAGYVLVGTRTARGVTMVSVVLGAPSLAARDDDSLALLRWGAKQYRRDSLVLRGTVVGTPEIRFRRGAQLPLVTGDAVSMIIPRRAAVTYRDVGVPEIVEGPIRDNQQFGRREVLVDGELVATVPVVASASVPAADLPTRTKDWFTRPLALLLAGAVLGGTFLMARRLRRGPPRRSSPSSEPEAA